MSEFDEATAVVASGDGRFEVNVDRRFSIGHAANGGYLMAVMLRAVLAGTTHAHPVSTSMHFLRAAGSGPDGSPPLRSGCRSWSRRWRNVRAEIM